MNKIVTIFVLIFIILNLALSQDTCNAPLAVNEIRICQTNCLLHTGKEWTINVNVTKRLDFVGGRDSLLLVNFNNKSLDYTVRIWDRNDKYVAKFALNAPNKLPPTESNGESYMGGVHHSVWIPGEFLKPFMKIQFNSPGLKSIFYYPTVTRDIDFTVWTLPFYLFGANEQNTANLSVTAHVEKAVVDELYEKWSVSTLKVVNHALGYFSWPYLVYPPSAGVAAKKFTGSDQKAGGYDIMSYTLNIMGQLRTEYGEANDDVQYYAPLLHLDTAGKWQGTGGGLGSYGRSSGDHVYSGIFIHEAGHGFNLPHAGESYNKGSYPYVNGSLYGSEWAFDKNHNEFLSILIPSNSGSYKNCNKSAVLDSMGRCVKQSIMQGGAGGQAQGYRFSLLADFEQVAVQTYFSSLKYVASTDSYVLWNATTKIWEPTVPKTSNNGLWSILQGFPYKRNVQVYTIIYSYSFAGGPTSELSQFYPIAKPNLGNLLLRFDPNNPVDMKRIQPNVSEFAWYCHDSGCDFTLRATYADGSIDYILINRGNRAYFSPTGAKKPTRLDPLSGDSFTTVVMNIRGDVKLSKIELLDTPMAWSGGVNNTAPILISKTL